MSTPVQNEIIKTKEESQAQGYRREPDREGVYIGRI